MTNWCLVIGHLLVIGTFGRRSITPREIFPRGYAVRGTGRTFAQLPHQLLIAVVVIVMLAVDLLLLLASTLLLGLVPRDCPAAGLSEAVRCADSCSRRLTCRAGAQHTHAALHYARRTIGRRSSNIAAGASGDRRRKSLRRSNNPVDRRRLPRRVVIAHPHTNGFAFTSCEGC